MKNWVEDFEKFLQIDEESPEYITPKGRIKKRKSVIGRLYASHNSVTGIIDVVMISLLGKRNEINDLVKNYGMVIMDECHHAGAQTSIDVLNEVNAKYVYGLTATPKRDDRQEKKIFMQFGPICYRYTAKDRAKAQGIAHYVYLRFTRLVHSDGERLKINDAYKVVITNEIRNQQIVDDFYNDSLVCTWETEPFYAAAVYMVKGNTEKYTMFEKAREQFDRELGEYLYGGYEEEYDEYDGELPFDI